MDPLICPTCGCSLVRLGIAPISSLSVRYRSVEYFFCCAACRDLFDDEPDAYLKETESLQVCPVCLAEKSTSHAVRAEYAGRVFHFCRCPHCLEEFHRRPEHYIDRLERRIKHTGVFGGEPSCCPTSSFESVVLQSTVTCPNCGHQNQETMPTDVCMFFYECLGCHTTLRPKPGDCCVFCSYGSVACPSVQSKPSAH